MTCANSPYSPELAAGFSEHIFSAGNLAAMSNGTSIARKSSPQESETDTCPSLPSSLTCVSSCSPVQPDSTEALRTWLAQAFPVSPSASPEAESAVMTNETCGPRRWTLFATYSLAPFSLKTCQDLFPADTLELSSVTWPRWGSWADGELSEQTTVELRTVENDSGLWPTPVASDTGSRKAKYSQGGTALSLAVKLWPTPTAGNHKSGGYLAEWGGSGAREAMKKLIPPEEMFGPLNPEWVEWLMGWSLGWTDLKPLVMDRFQEWSQQHGKPSDNATRTPKEQTK